MPIPQISSPSSALRLAMIACGTVALSLMGREMGEAEKQSTAVMRRYAMQATQNLPPPNRSFIETVLTTWTFWQLDMLCGKIKSSMMHTLRAHKLLLKSPSRLSSDALASSFLASMINGMPVISELENMIAGSNFETTEPFARKKLAVKQLWTVYRQVCEGHQRVKKSECAPKARILGMLDVTRQEIQWALSRWEEPQVYLQWLESNRSNSSLRLEPPSRDPSPATNDPPGPFSQIVNDLGLYLAGKHGFSIDECLYQASNSMLLFLVVTAASDVEMRQDALEFAEFSNKIRQIHTTPTMDALNAWPSYADLFPPRPLRSFPTSDHELSGTMGAEASSYSRPNAAAVKCYPETTACFNVKS
jgi:hypothetical protein